MECFVAVAETLHFGTAAERLGIGQPALSRVVARLERRLGVILFNRTTRRVTLTPAGESFLAECRRILTDIEGAIRRVQRSARPARVTLRYGREPVRASWRTSWPPIATSPAVRPWRSSSPSSRSPRSVTAPPISR
jgi:DNA-binding transcriptional LysR family regulator